MYIIKNLELKKIFKRFALKVLPLRSIHYSELDLLKDLKSSFIVQLQDFFHEEFSIGIVLEYCEVIFSKKFLEIYVFKILFSFNWLAIWEIKLAK